MYHVRIGDRSPKVSAEEPVQPDSADTTTEHLDPANMTAADEQASGQHLHEPPPTQPDSAAEESTEQQASAPGTGAGEVQEVPVEQPEGSAVAVHDEPADAPPGEVRALEVIKKNKYELGESQDVFGCLDQIRQSFEFSKDRCAKCTNPMRAFKGQLKSKTSRIMICDARNRATTMLSRHITWPPQEWASLSPAMIQQFWKNAGTIQQGTRLNWKRLKTILITSLSQAIHSEKKSKVEEQGEFQPLSWYARKGYEISAIRDNTALCNQQYHPVLKETTYRLPILSISYADVHAEITTRLTNLEGTRRMRSSAKALQGDQALALEDTTAIGDAEPAASAASESDSSSSSSSDKKKKKEEVKKTQEKQTRQVR